MSQKIRFLFNSYVRLLAIGAGLCMAAIFFIVLINSLRRYGFGKSLIWGEQLPVFLAVYGVMFGTAWAYMQDLHVRFTMLVGVLSNAMVTRLFMLVDLITAFSGGLLAYSAYLFMQKRGAVEASGMIGLAKDLKASTGWDGWVIFGTMSPYHFALLLGGVLLVIAALLKFFSRIAGPETEQSKTEQTNTDLEVS